MWYSHSKMSTREVDQLKTAGNENISAKIKEELNKLIDIATTAGKKLSKNQSKKLLKKAKWNVYKPERKAREKEKRKRRKAETRAMCDDAPPKKKFKLMKDSTCKVKVAIDLSFGDLMNDDEISKTVKQVQRCYSSNRHSEAPLQMYLTSVSDKVKANLSSKSGCMNWDVHYLEQDFLKSFSKEEIVYLSSESPNSLDKLDESKIYVIGGLVDHNKHKGLSHKLAKERCIAHAKLPIDDVLIMRTRKVLSIYHVFEILLNVAQGDSWKEALLKCLPKRKCATAKGETLSEKIQDSDECDSDDDSDGGAAILVNDDINDDNEIKDS